MSTEEIRKYAHLKWYAVMTKPKAEKRTKAFFVSSGIPCYLPLVSHTHIQRFTRPNGKLYERRRAPRPAPMFPGYIFAALDLNTLSETRCRATVSRVLLNENYSEEQLIAELKIVNRFEMLSKNNQVEIKPHIIEGTPVIISKGPFKGWEGIVKQRQNNNYLHIVLNTIGYTANIQCAVMECDII